MNHELWGPLYAFILNSEKEFYLMEMPTAKAVYGGTSVQCFIQIKQNKLYIKHQQICGLVGYVHIYITWGEKLNLVFIGTRG